MAAAVIRAFGEPGDLGWVVMTHGEVYATEFGWNTEFETVVARLVTGFAEDHDPSREAAWIATANGRRVGCAFLIAKSDDVAQLRALLVHPDGRGQRLGSRLVLTAVDFARAAGYRRIALWTDHPLTAARKLYLDAGFTLIREEAHRDFGVDLVGQWYERELGEATLSA
jgi:GNAT superfamily N-acetyltransferase